MRITDLYPNHLKIRESASGLGIRKNFR